MTYMTVTGSPIGPITLLSSESAVTGIYLSTQKPDLFQAVSRDTHPLLLQAKAWLERYFSGQRPDPLSLPLAPAGSKFQKKVWDRLLGIPYGSCTTYGEIAKEISPAMSAQAVGGAVGRNPISIVIPCHRVIGAGGNLTGYAGGLDNKMFLLNLEGIDTGSLKRPRI